MSNGSGSSSRQEDIQRINQSFHTLLADVQQFARREARQAGAVLVWFAIGAVLALIGALLLSQVLVHLCVVLLAIDLWLAYLLVGALLVVVGALVMLLARAQI